MRFAFIAREKATYSIVMRCRVLRVSWSGYYAWRNRQPSVRVREDAVLTEQITTIHEQSRQTYGAPRIHAELRAVGRHCGRQRVARLMRAANIVGCHRRRRIGTTIREPTSPVAPDRVDRQFVASRLNVLWTADITSVPTAMGFLSLAVVLDVCSRRIVGWAMAEHLRTDLVCSALDMARWNRRPERGVIHHADHGCQYTSVAFGQHCQDLGIERSMGSVGDCFDNAITESFFATPGALWAGCELLDRYVFRTHAAARTAIFADIEGFYTPHRRHSALGYLSPAAFERQISEERAA